MRENGQPKDANLQEAADEAAAELPGQVAAAVASIRAHAAKALGGAVGAQAWITGREQPARDTEGARQIGAGQPGCPAAH